MQTVTLAQKGIVKYCEVMYASEETLIKKKKKVYNVEISDKYQVAKFDKNV